MATIDNKLISHKNTSRDIDNLIKHKSKQIINGGVKNHISIKKQLEILNKLSQFDFGRFLLQNQGVNGFWTHYVLTYSWKNRNYQNDIEKFLLEQAPTILATQERFQIFLNENQKSVANNKKLACIPCGMMGELLYLNFNAINNIQLIGIDYDISALNEAKKLAAAKKLLDYTIFHQADAWNLNLKNKFDHISSNGLNIYEPNEKKVIALYKQFYEVLKPNGKLVTSFLTPPPSLTKNCEWNMEFINTEDLLLQKLIFVDIIQAKWQCYRSTQQTKLQLESVGFKDIYFIPDKANLFPTVTAIKT
jgi:SAM-dependent methyltransferase